MKIAVVNFSGNVGKSTVARHVLAPRMNNARVIPVETINSDGTEDEAFRGREFGDLWEQMSLIDDAVVDVGASNIEDFVNLMGKYIGSHEDFDYFVIPTVPKKKQMKDTISTIDALVEVGVPAKKIRVVFNMVGDDEQPERIFGGLFEYHSAEGLFTLTPEAVLHSNDIYDLIKGKEQTIAEVLADPTDYKAKIKETEDKNAKLGFARCLSIKMLAKGVSREMDAVFKALLN